MKNNMKDFLGGANRNERLAAYSIFEANGIEIDQSRMDGGCDALVKNSDGTVNQVYLSFKKKRKSRCDCAKAQGKRSVCRHMLATYFALFPMEARRYYIVYLAPIEHPYYQRRILYHNLQQYIKKADRAMLVELIYDLAESVPDETVEMISNREILKCENKPYYVSTEEKF